MLGIMGPKVTRAQGPIVTALDSNLFGSMPGSQTTQKHEFASRLNEVCDDKGLPVHGRQTALAREFQVGPKAARKWLVGEGYPETDMAVRIAKWGGVSFNWLMTGQGQKREGFTDTKIVVLGEMLESMPRDERQQAFDFIEYKIRGGAAPLFTGERLARYLAMIDAFKKDRDKKD